MKPEEVMVQEYNQLKEEIRVSQVKGQNSITFVFVVALISYLKIFYDTLINSGGEFFSIVTLVFFPLIYGAIMAFYLKNFFELMTLGSYLLKLEIKINCFFSNNGFKQNVMGWENYLGEERKRQKLRKFQHIEYSYYGLVFFAVYVIQSYISFKHLKLGVFDCNPYSISFIIITVINVIVVWLYSRELSKIFKRMDKDFENRNKCE